MTAIIKYPGSKWRTAEWIISHFPPHHSYLEPFFGSGGVLFNKPRSNIETVNDLDSEVVNLFQWIKRDPERLAHEIHWTPYAREVYDRAFLDMHTETDPFQRAVNFYIRMMFGHGFRTTGEKVGWKNDVQGRERAYAASCWFETPENVIAAAERLRGVQIEHCPAVEVIRRFNDPKVLIYADPPYVLGTRGNRKQYRHEMTDADHEELLEALKAHTGPVEVLSMYDGMSCGHIALDKLGANVMRYYATEIDKYAIQTTQRNYPDTIQLGDAFQVRWEGWPLREER